MAQRFPIELVQQVPRVLRRLTSWRRNTSPCSQNACNSLDFQERPVFQVGRYDEVLRLCPCEISTNHMTFNAGASCHMYQTRVKFRRVRRLE